MLVSEGRLTSEYSMPLGRSGACQKIVKQLLVQSEAKNLVELLNS